MHENACYTPSRGTTGQYVTATQKAAIGPWRQGNPFLAAAIAEYLKLQDTCLELEQDAAGIKVGVVAGKRLKSQLGRQPVFSRLPTRHEEDTTPSLPG
jgi:hypothetical protein